MFRFNEPNLYSSVRQEGVRVAATPQRGERGEEPGVPAHHLQHELGTVDPWSTRGINASNDLVGLADGLPGKLVTTGRGPRRTGTTSQKRQ